MTLKIFIYKMYDILLTIIYLLYSRIDLLLFIIIYHIRKLKNLQCNNCIFFPFVFHLKL